jgi:acyl carrier protein
MNDRIIAELKTLIANELDTGLGADDIHESSPFFEGGLNVDSIAIVELIVLVEERFGIAFEDWELVPETFQTIRVLAEKIQGKLSAVQQDALA